MAKASKSEFTPITDEKTVLRYLRYMVDLHCEIDCAVRETDIRFTTTPIRFVEERLVHLRMKNEIMSAEDLMKKVRATKAERIDLSYNAHEILIFASTRLTLCDRNAIALEIESPIFKLQRRDHLRVKPSKEQKCQISIYSDKHRPVQVFELYDISVNGFSILVTQEEAASFTVGQSLEKIVYRFSKHETKVNAKVQNKVPIRGPKKTHIKIGFITSTLPHAFEEEIVRFAFLQSLKILGRRL